MSKNTGYVRPSNQIQGLGGIEVSGAEIVKVDGSALARSLGGGITPFRFERLQSSVTTSSTVFVDLMDLSPVVVTHDGNVLLDFRASIRVEQADLSLQEAEFRYLWDGSPLIDLARIGLFLGTPATQIGQNFLDCVTLRSLVAAAKGSHTLSVQWRALTATTLLTALDQFVNATIEGKP